MTLVRRLQMSISVSKNRSCDDTWLIFGCRTVCCSLCIRGVRWILTSFYFDPKLVVSPRFPCVYCRILQRRKRKLQLLPSVLMKRQKLELSLTAEGGRLILQLLNS